MPHISQFFYFVPHFYFIHTTSRSVPVSKFTGSAGSLTTQQLTSIRSSNHSDLTLISRTMQELMNSITHQWSHPLYRLNHSPLSIVQDGGDTTINGTVPIYLQTSPDLCHHVRRGIKPCGRAITAVPAVDRCFWLRHRSSSVPVMQG